MFEKPWNIAAYGLTAALLVTGIVRGTNVTAFMAVLVFLLWDIGYLMSKRSMHGRSIESALQQTQNIREHISYFLAFYGVLFAVLFTQPSERQAQFLQICNDAGISTTLLVLPFLFALIPLLFFPIQPAREGGHEASSALKALVSLSAFFQKVSIFLFAHVVLRILFTLTR